MGSDEEVATTMRSCTDGFLIEFNRGPEISLSNIATGHETQGRDNVGLLYGGTNFVELTGRAGEVDM